MFIQNKNNTLIFLISLLLVLDLGPSIYVAAQGDFDAAQTRGLTPSTIVIIIIGIIFILTGFLAVFLRQFSGGCFGLNVESNPPFTATGLPGSGLDPEAIKSLPTYFYSDVKQHRKGKVELECAVCLNEFQDSEALRLLPGCSHVFHPRCIDTWLASHVTCPICRQTLEPGSGADKSTTIISIPLAGSESDGPDHPRDYQRDQHHDVGGYKSAGDDGDGKEMKRIVRKFRRSHSTGHSLADSDRFTLRLPDEVRTNLVNRSGDTLLLTTMPSPRCGWFSMTPPIIIPRTRSFRSPIRAGLNIPGFNKKQSQSPVKKTSEHLWPI